MGATAFLIAEFLQIPYSEVVLAAAVPAAIFYLVMYVQIDSYAARNALHGLPRSELPKIGAVPAHPANVHRLLAGRGRLDLRVVHYGRGHFVPD